MGSTARRTAGTAAAGLIALAGLGLLVAPQASGEAAAALLALAMGVGVLQVLAGLWLVAGEAPVEQHVADRGAWGAGWVLDGVRAIGLAAALWMLFAPDAQGLVPAGVVVLVAVLASAPFGRRLDRRAAPRLAPGTYVVRPTPMPTTLAATLERLDVGPSRAVTSARVVVDDDPRRHLHVVREASAPYVHHRVDTRL